MRARGFTLIEMIVTLAIVSLLATMAMPVAELTVRRGKERELRSALREIRSALDAWKRAGDEGHIVRIAGESGYPPSLEVLEQGVEDARSPDRRRLYFLRRVPRDPFAANPGQPAAATWGLRSYESAPDDPQPGRDVYDVRSLAPGRGLDGRPYSEW